MKHYISLALNISAAWLAFFALAQFGLGYVLCCGGNVGALIYGLAAGLTSTLVAGCLAKLAEWLEFGFTC